MNGAIIPDDGHLLGRCLEHGAGNINRGESNNAHRDNHAA
jgi:hypothetical protein